MQVRWEVLEDGGGSASCAGAEGQLGMANTSLKGQLLDVGLVLQCWRVSLTLMGRHLEFCLKPLLLTIPLKK